MHEIELEHADLRVRFRDNAKSPGRLSGIARLVNVREAEDFTAFDPGSGAHGTGGNFEHIISGHEDPHSKFSPRLGPYRMELLEAGPGVRLIREKEDSPWSVESTMDYRLAAPHYIDMTFRCRAHDVSRFGARGYALMFWANYMNDVIDVPIHFRGIATPDAEETWIAGDGPDGHPDWNCGGTYMSANSETLTYDDELQFRLNSWSYDYPRFTQPFYYGKAARDMVFLLMFDRACTDIDEIRFSIFKFKLKQWPRPAWDFQYVIRRVEAGREYGFRARLAWKRFIGPDDCLDEYARWKDRAEAD